MNEEMKDSGDKKEPKDVYELVKIIKEDFDKRGLVSEVEYIKQSKELVIGISLIELVKALKSIPHRIIVRNNVLIIRLLNIKEDLKQ